MHNLAIDIGNTRIKFGLFSGEQCLDTAIYACEKTEDWQSWLTNHLAENIILSSVGSQKVTRYISDFLKKINRKPTELNYETPVPIIQGYQTPSTLGKDRLAAVVGAYALFPNTNCLVIDAGTCITYDFIDESGVYHGGNIAPGIQMRMRAMHDFTARLPLPERKWADDWIGKTTKSALQNGSLFGILLECEGYMLRGKQRFGNMNVLLTGGDSQILAEKLKSQIFVNQNLVLHGLNKILNYNVERSE